jgi:hypothetical protein
MKGEVLWASPLIFTLGVEGERQRVVIPGHGAVGDKSQLAFYRDLLVGTREKVAALKKQGKSLDEVVATKPTAATDAMWGNGLWRFFATSDF